MKKTCTVSGKEFEISDQEIALRKKLGIEGLPEVVPQIRFRNLGAFWQHWNLHKRKCDFSEKPIISVFSEYCPYPVWHKNEWIKNANPPGADFDENKEIFPQMWEFFQKSAIPHNFQSHNENCEYTDDFWYSKNCYLCHSGQKQEDARYSYGCDSIKNSFWCVFSMNSELCTDLINSKNCFESFYLLNCKNVQNSAFLYDCRNCSNCLFCFNLRNKKYCFGNQQLTKEEFEKKKKEWDFSNQTTYQKAKEFFMEMMKGLAWHRALEIDKSENTSGNYLSNCKDCVDCFMTSKHENCVHDVFSGPDSVGTLDSLGTVGAQWSISSVLPVFCYETKFCFSTDHSKFVEYSAFLKNCENCFGCCGLVGKKYHIFNKPYSEAEYFALKEKIVAHMKSTGEYGQFFPGYFAANPYDESWSSFHFPLSQAEQEKLGFRLQENEERKNENYSSPTEIPDSSEDVDLSITKKTFWDEKAKKPFQIQKADIEFAQKLNIPLPNEFYISRIQDNFRWLFFDGSLRETTCGKCNVEIKTNWPEKYDGRILCEKCYLGIIK